MEEVEGRSEKEYSKDHGEVKRVVEIKKTDSQQCLCLKSEGASEPSN